MKKREKSQRQEETWQKSVIPEGQVQKRFEKGEVIGLQGSTEMSKMQGMKSIHYTTLGSLGMVDGWREQEERNWKQEPGYEKRAFLGWKRTEYVYVSREKSR